jgi:hypothetical protein
MSWQGSLQFIHHHYPPKPHLSFYQSSSGCDDLGVDPNINKKKHVLAAILGQTKRSQPSFYHTLVGICRRVGPLGWNVDPEIKGSRIEYHKHGLNQQIYNLAHIFAPARRFSSI